MLHYITWNPDPEIFRIGSFAIRWYVLLFASAFAVGYLILRKIFKFEKLPEKLLYKLIAYLFIATVIGARLGHCFFYDSDYFLRYPIEILMIWKGGFASHGAVIAIIIALLIFSKKYNIAFIWLLDRIAIVLALAGCFIRTGNLMNSEIFGKPFSASWAFIYSRYDYIPRHPTQIYQALSYLLIFLFLYFYYWNKKGKPASGFLSGMFMVLVFTVRFFVEFLKEPQVAFEKSMTLNMGQLLSIPFVLMGLLVLFWSGKNRSINV